MPSAPSGQPQPTTSHTGQSQASATSVNPFTLGPPPKPRGFFARLFFQSRPADAYRAIVNRLAASSIEDVTAAAISADLIAFGVRGDGARRLLGRIWREVIEKFIADDETSEAEARYLAGLRRVLGLSLRELREIEDEVVQGRYGRAVAQAIADDALTPAERSRLERLAKAIRLPADVAARLLERARQERLTEATNAATSDNRLSPAELADLHALASSLGTTLEVDADTQRAFDRLSLLWRIDNGDLPVIDVPILLQRKEVCHAAASAVWMEMRTHTQRINYGGPVASIRICKGLRYRVGSVQVQRITRDELTEIDRGRLYVTNKRIIFDGARRNRTMRLSSLISFTPCTDGVILEKASGKPPHLLLSDTDIELFHAILGAALAQA